MAMGTIIVSAAAHAIPDGFPGVTVTGMRMTKIPAPEKPAKIRDFSRSYSDATATNQIPALIIPVHQAGAFSRTFSGTKETATAK